ncbi:MAG TPA: chorismate mutase [Eubacteriaceae bacterium]|nr:chorismate mutase [Eubacteriaceae bacterium]
MEGDGVMNKLDRLRKEIDEIDRDMLELFRRRMKVVREVAAYKKENNMEIFRPEREQEIIEKYRARVSQEEKDLAEEFIRAVMKISKDVQAEECLE